MKCNKETDMVCTSYERCKLAWFCPNVPIGIITKLKKEKINKIKINS